jgi:transposase
MYIERTKSKVKDKVYQQILLRESYREPGAPRNKVKKRTLLNLTHCKPAEIKALQVALKYKNDPDKLAQLLDSEIEQRQGLSIGAVWVMHHLVKDSGLLKVLGKSREAMLCIWMIMARLIDQGSRLSAVRLAEEHGACELLGLDDFNENDLYNALDWLCDNQAAIEQKLFKQSYGKEKPSLFLYDVTSSYLEGQQNELADWGYNRDKKKGKKQVVIGLLCDDQGSPVSVRVFKGNTLDFKTVGDQIKKVVEEFSCRQVTMVGDRGMIKSGQIEDLGKAGFNYITAITKSQVRSMIKKKIIQLGLFDEKVCEVEHSGVRYILRRNPIRAAELARSRRERIAKAISYAQKQNQYLADHPKADPHVAIKKVWENESRLKVSDFLHTTASNRIITVKVYEEYLSEIAELDGCYVLKTDLPADVASAEIIHDRYKDLAQVETAFRTMKTGYLEMRPIYVRKENRTRAHAFVVMLAYRLFLKLKQAWQNLDITVEEGLKRLSTHCTIENLVNGQISFLSIPAPRQSLSDLYGALNINPPITLPKRSTNVATKKKLTKRRKKK